MPARLEWRRKGEANGRFQAEETAIFARFPHPADPPALRAPPIAAAAPEAPAARERRQAAAPMPGNRRKTSWNPSAVRRGRPSLFMAPAPRLCPMPSARGWRRIAGRLLAVAALRVARPARLFRQPVSPRGKESRGGASIRVYFSTISPKDAARCFHTARHGPRCLRRYGEWRRPARGKLPSRIRPEPKGHRRRRKQGAARDGAGRGRQSARTRP